MRARNRKLCVSRFGTYETENYFINRMIGSKVIVMESGGFCEGVKLARGGCVTNCATRLVIIMFVYLQIHHLTLRFPPYFSPRTFDIKVCQTIFKCQSTKTIPCK